MKKILFCAGGTLGHLTPLLNVASYFKEKNKDFMLILVTTKKDLKFNNLFSIFDKVYYVDCGDIKICNIIKNLKALYYLNKIIKSNKINYCFGFGGYISGLCIFSSSLNKVKCFIHEQNKIMGRANKISLKYCDKVFLSFPSEKYKGIVVGNIVNLKNNTRVYKEKKTILFVSGTNGSLFINKLAIAFCKAVEDKDYNVIIVTSDAYYDMVNDNVNSFKNCKVYKYVSNMNELLRKAAIVITRCGSASLFEAYFARCLMIMIPSNNVVNNHQYYNACEFKDYGKILLEQHTTLETLLNTIDELYLRKDDIYKNFDKGSIICDVDKIYKEIKDE